MEKTSLSSKNLARRSTTISMGILFVISAAVAFLILCGIFWFTTVRSSVETLNEYGYNYLTYEGEEVSYGSYQ